MKDWLAAHAANGFREFAGTQIAASIHVSEALINEALANALGSVSLTAGRGAEPPDPIAGAMLKLVTRAVVKAAEGVVIVDVELRVPPDEAGSGPDGSP